MRIVGIIRELWELPENCGNVQWFVKELNKLTGNYGISKEFLGILEEFRDNFKEIEEMDNKEKLDIQEMNEIVGITR